jgi:hypothetical protein
MRFCIAGIAIDSILSLPAASFLSSADGREADVQIALSSVLCRNQETEKSHYSDGIAVYPLVNQGWLFEDCSTSHRVQIIALKDYAHLSVYVDTPSAYESLTRLLRLPLECRFVHEGVISLHAACVEEGATYTIKICSNEKSLSTPPAWRKAVARCALQEIPE